MEFDGTVGACWGGSLTELWAARSVVRRPRVKRRPVDASSVSFEFFPNVRARRSIHFGLFGFAMSNVGRLKSLQDDVLCCAVRCCAQG